MLLKTVVALVPAFVLFSGSIVLFSRQKTVSSLLQLLGAGCLVMVVLTHVSEPLRLFPWMDWGLEDSVGHYLDPGECSARSHIISDRYCSIHFPNSNESEFALSEPGILRDSQPCGPRHASSAFRWPR